MPPFGAFFEKSHGHVVTTVLVAMVAMLFTAVSYGRMARVYPSAGSAYSYVAQEIHPAFGFATGSAGLKPRQTGYYSGEILLTSC